MDTQETPAAVLLMSQLRRLAGLLVLNGVPAEDVEREARLAADTVAAEVERRRLHVVPAAG